MSFPKVTLGRRRKATFLLCAWNRAEGRSRQGHIAGLFLSLPPLLVVLQTGSESWTSPPSGVCLVTTVTRMQASVA